MLLGLVLLFIGWLMGTDPVSAKSSTHFFGFDLVQAFTDLVKGRLGGLGLFFMLFVMMGIMVVATIVTGSGNSAFFAFSPLLPEAATSVGYNTMALVVPVQLAASLARPMSPISGVTIAVSGIAGLTPIELIRRTMPVMIIGMIVNIVASNIFL